MKHPRTFARPCEPQLHASAGPTTASISAHTIAIRIADLPSAVMDGDPWGRFNWAMRSLACVLVLAAAACAQPFDPGPRIAAVALIEQGLTDAALDVLKPAIEADPRW